MESRNAPAASLAQTYRVLLGWNAAGKRVFLMDATGMRPERFLTRAAADCAAEVAVVPRHAAGSGARSVRSGRT